MRLFTVRGSEERPALLLEPDLQHIGRGPGNDLVLAHDPAVSSEHATVWLEDGHGWIRDLGSRNGTFVNGARIRATALRDGDTIEIGAVTLVARGRVAKAAATRKIRMLEDLDTGLRYPFAGQRIVIGSHAGADLKVDMGDAELALSLLDDGEIWSSSLEDDAPLAVGEAFPAGDRRFAVVEVEVSASATEDLGVRRAPYQLRVRLDASTGAQAELTDPDADRTHTVNAETRATLLYLLAKARLNPFDTADGWLSDAEAGVGIWGRKGSEDARKLHVVIHRLRKELRQAGFDPWFIEKRRRAVRLALDAVAIG